MIQNQQKSAIKLILKRYWLIILLMLFIANFGLLYAIRMYGLAQTCFTTDQVAADNRCLYIWSNKVFEKGTKTSPHYGHPCGMDVTVIIPGFHLSDMAKYMDPSYLGSICTANPTATTAPTQVPSETPVPTLEPTHTPTLTPANIPTPTILPTDIITVTIAPTRADSCTLPAAVTNIRINCGNCLGN